MIHVHMHYMYMYEVSLYSTSIWLLEFIHNRGLAVKYTYFEIRLILKTVICKAFCCSICLNYWGSLSYDTAKTEALSHSCDMIKTSTCSKIIDVEQRYKIVNPSLHLTFIDKFVPRCISPVLCKAKSIRNYTLDYI